MLRGAGFYRRSTSATSQLASALPVKCRRNVPWPTTAITRSLACARSDRPEFGDARTHDGFGLHVDAALVGFALGMPPHRRQVREVQCRELGGKIGGRPADVAAVLHALAQQRHDPHRRRARMLAKQTDRGFERAGQRRDEHELDGMAKHDARAPAGLARGRARSSARPNAGDRRGSRPTRH